MDKDWKLKLEPPTDNWPIPNVLDGPCAFPKGHEDIDESVCFSQKTQLSFNDDIWIFDFYS